MTGTVTHTRCPLPVCRAAELDAQPPEEKWTIHSLCTRSALMVVGGHPKIGKSWLGLDMAVSVASGTPCLGEYEVEQRGTALIYLAEDALPAVRARIQAICDHRRLDIDKLDVLAITADRLQLHIPDHARSLWETVEQLRPTLLLLDPLVRLHRFDENSSHDMAGIFDYLRGMQRVLGTTVVLVHHVSKKARAHPGQALRGTGDLWAFGDSYAFLTRRDEGILLTTEHRAAPAAEPAILELRSRPDGSATHLHVVGSAAATVGPPLEERVLALLGNTSRPMLRAEIRGALKVNNKRLGDALISLQRGGQLKRTADGWVCDQLRPSASAAQQSDLFAS